MARKRNKILFTFLLLLFCCGSVFAQPNTDEQLAVQYFQEKEFEKAVSLFEDLYNKKPSPFYYNYYLDCLFELGDFKKAEKFLSRLVKKEPENDQYGVDLGYVYERSGDQAAARKQYESLIRSVEADAQKITSLANAFQLREKFDYMLEVYLQGRKLLKSGYTFQLEIAALYSARQQFEDAVGEYLDLLDYNQGYTDKVQSLLQEDVITDSARSEVFKNTLLTRIRKFPDRKYYSELLLWFFVQKKDFNAALIQARSLDKRFSESGSRIFDLAQLAVSNQDYGVAVECYNYIIEKKGPDSPYYNTSRFEIINVRYIQLSASFKADRAFALQLERDFLALLSEIGISANSLPYVRNLASLQAFYLGKTDTAALLLQMAMNVPNARSEDLARCKMDLADILLMKGDVWEATLLYSQVEKAYKNDVTGFEAKFRNARLFYYIGEFDYARAQLDILKASTSKLIANDALYLSLLIAENLDSDSTTTGLRIYAAADLLVYQKQYEAALQKLDSIPMLALTHPLLDEVLFKKADIQMKKGNYSEADTLLNRLVNFYPWDILADDALYKLGELNENVFNNKARAMEYYAKLISSYPGSVYVVDARKRYRSLRGDTRVSD